MSRVAVLACALSLLAAAEAGFADAVREAAGDEAVGAAEERQRALTSRAGDKRPTDQYRTSVLGRPLTIGGELELRSSREDDYALERDEAADRTTLRSKIELELLWELSEDLHAFAEVKARYAGDLERQGRSRHGNAGLERGELWLHAAGLGGSDFSVQVGRQNFKDKREWWWDEDLEAIRLYWEREGLRAEIAYAQQLGRVSTLEDFAEPELREVGFLMGHLQWTWARKNRLELFAARRTDHSDSPELGTVMHRDRRDESDARLLWFGARAMGRAKVDHVGRFYYWADLARVSGSEEYIDFDGVPFDRDLRIADERITQSVRGWAADAGFTWQWRRDGPGLTFGYAVGSGSAGSGEHPDGSFRQTGLQDNNGKFRGANRFRLYGELLRPELSNLHVATFSVGVPLFSDSSLELVYHHYRQDEASEFLRDTDLDTVPGGRGRTLGQELDLVVGLEEWEHLEVELIGSVFRAGAAFERESGEFAHLVAIKIDYNF